MSTSNVPPQLPDLVADAALPGDFEAPLDAWKRDHERADKLEKVHNYDAVRRPRR